MVLIAVNLYADGNLIVNGKIGIGTGDPEITPPSTYFQVATDDDWQDAIRVNGTYRADPISGTTVGSAAIAFETIVSSIPP